MKKLLVFLSIVILLVISSCTENQKVRTFGGKATIDLPKGQKLVNVTWKETNLWYITKPMSPKDSAETYVFQEDSNFGIMNGVYTFVEHK